MFIRNHKLRLFLFSLFFLYTISPISYTSATNSAAESDGSGNGSHLTRKFHIYLWELIYAQLTSHEDTESSGSAVKILLKKKRAVMPKNITPESVHIETSSLPENYFVPSAHSLMEFSLDHNIVKSFKVVDHALHSGLSPPLI